jgi:regulator of cell morphogenesis and NO signaling
MIHEKMKMAELIHSNYHILPIINRFGIYPGVGDKTIEQICAEKNINKDFFLQIVNVFLDENYFPANELKKFKIENIVNYLQKSHEYFINVKLESLENKIKELTKHCCESNNKHIKLIENFYLEYKKELIEHIEYENKVIYPYVLWLSENQNKKSQNIKTPNLRIQQYLDNHSDIEEKIFDLKNIFIKYLPTEKHIELINEILFELFDFQKDIDDHQRIEEKVLVPKAREIEEKIFD